MKIRTKPAPLVTQQLLTRIALSIVAGTGIISSLLPQTVLADPNYDQPLEQFKKDQRGPEDLNSTSNGGGFNILNLMHQAQQGAQLDATEFNREQVQNLDSATAKFRLQQQQLLRNSNQAQPATPVTKKMMKALRLVPIGRATLQTSDES